MSVVLMSKRELNRLEVLARLNSNRLMVAAAAGLMNVTPRQTYRPLSRYRNGGAPAIANRRRGRPSADECRPPLKFHGNLESAGAEIAQVKAVVQVGLDGVLVVLEAAKDEDRCDEVDVAES
jgi:hypothetical protein